MTATGTIQPLQVCTVILLLRLLCTACGELHLPTVVRAHAGQTTHILCTYTCPEAESCDVRLGWRDPPQELRSWEGCYNATHHSLNMIVTAGSEERETTQIVTCVAVATDGRTLTTGTTHLQFCPTEKLACRCQPEPSQPSPNEPTVNKVRVHVCACKYQSKCATVVRCRSATEDSPMYLGNNNTGLWHVAVYKFTTLTPGDNVTCHLHSPSMQEHLQTRFEVMLPEESSPGPTTTQAPLADPALPTQVPDEDTNTHQTPSETSIPCPPNTCPPNTCPPNTCPPTLLWILLVLTAFVVLVVCVGICCHRNPPAHTGTSIPM